MPKFVSNIVEIEAHRIGIDPWPEAAWEAVTRNEIILHNCGDPNGYVIVKTLEGDMRGHHGDWLIRGTEGEFYPCKPSVFAAKYVLCDAPSRDISIVIDEITVPDGWQDISTAPRDGTPILAADKGPFSYVVEWSSYLCIWIGADRHAWEPTHWQPLPALPGTAAPKPPPDTLSSAVEEERARVIEKCAQLAETPHEDDDGIDLQVKRRIAASIRTLAHGDSNDR